MYALELIIDTDVLNAVEDAARRFPTLMATAYRRQAQRIRADLLKELRTAPAALPELPFIWSLDPARQARARAWYFANKVPRGSQGGRYQRTGALLAAWEVIIEADQDGGFLAVQNNASGFNFVIGPWQVPSHTFTGWYRSDDVILKYSEIANDRLIETVFTVADPFAGV